MAIEKKSILARIQVALDKSAAKENKRRTAMLAAVKTAMGELPVEYVESGKRILVALNGAKVGVVGTVAEACAVTAEGRVGYVKVSPKELAEYVKELVARDKK